MEKKHLDFIIALLKELKKTGSNDWFWSEISVLSNNNQKSIDNNLIGLISSNVESIHKYLTLDIIPLIDYAEIQEERVRNQLSRDCLEMGKYRLGKYNNKIDFDAFCQYAHMQAEELLNYFLLKKYQNISDILEFLKAYNPLYENIDNPPNSVLNIPYKRKLFAFDRAFNIGWENKTVLIKINDIRNERSHRCAFTKEEDERILNDYYSKEYDKLNKDERKQAGIKEICERVNLIDFSKKADFEKIYLAIDVLKQKVIQNVN